MRRHNVGDGKIGSPTTLNFGPVARERNGAKKQGRIPIPANEGKRCFRQLPEVFRNRLPVRLFRLLR